MSQVSDPKDFQCSVPPSHSTEACNLPIVPGPCRGSTQLWAFDAVKGKCVLFIYGGCKGNSNQFYSEKECKEYCGIPGEGRRPDNARLGLGDIRVQVGEPW